MKIKCNNVSKKIKNEIVLSDINLEFESGKIYGIRGKNGSGKTMLLRAIAGLILTDGNISIDNFTITSKDRFYTSMGLIIETTGFYEHLSAFDNLKVLAKIKDEIGDEEINIALDNVGLTESKNKKVKEYSLGMKQKLAIAQAIMESPKLLLLDEPTNALDEESRIAFNRMLKHYINEERLIIITNHDREELEDVCDVIIRMSDGKIQE